MPANAPLQGIVERLNTELSRIVSQPETREKLASLGAEPATMKPAEFAAYIRSETEKWSKVAKSANINPN